MHADAEPDRQPGAGQLLDDLQVGLVGLAAAAEPSGYGQAEQPGLAERRELLPREPAVALGLRRRRGRSSASASSRVRPSSARGGVVADLALDAGHQASTTTSSRVTLLSRSPPSSVQTTMSSIRAPCGPG